MEEVVSEEVRPVVALKAVVEPLEVALEAVVEPLEAVLAAVEVPLEDASEIEFNSQSLPKKNVLSHSNKDVKTLYKAVLNKNKPQKKKQFP